MTLRLIRPWRLDDKEQRERENKERRRQQELLTKELERSRSVFHLRRPQLRAAKLVSTEGAAPLIAGARPAETEAEPERPPIATEAQLLAFPEAQRPFLRDLLGIPEPEPPKRVREDRGGIGPFLGDVLELLGQVGESAGAIPLPGGPITAAPSVRGGRPGATISGVRPQTVADVDRFESELAKRTTKPIGRFLGETAVKGALPGTPLPLQALGVPEIPIPGRERAKEIAGDVGATVSGELLRVSNAIPIPVIDPLVARAISLPIQLARGGARVAPEAAQAILRRIRGVADDAAVEPAVRQAASRNADEIAAAIESGELRVAGGADDIPQVPGEPVPEVPDDFEVVQGILSPEDIAAGQRLGVRDIVGAQLERDVARLEASRRAALSREVGRDPLAGTRNPPGVGGRDLPGAALERLEPLPLERALARDFPTRIRETAPARPPSAGGRDLPGEALGRRPDQFESEIAKDFPRRVKFPVGRPVSRAERDIVGEALTRLSDQPDRVIPITVRGREFTREEGLIQVDRTRRLFDDARERLTAVRRNVRDGIVSEGQMAEAAEDLAATREGWQRARNAMREEEIRVSFDDIANRARRAGADDQFVEILRAGYDDSLRLIPNDEPLLTASSLRQRIAKTVAAVEGTPPGTIGAIAQQRHIVEAAIRRTTEEALNVIAKTLDRTLYREIDAISYTGSRGAGPKGWEELGHGGQIDFMHTNGIKDRVIVQHPDWFAGMSPELRQALKQAQEFQEAKLQIAETMGYPIKAIEGPYLEQIWETTAGALETQLPGFPTSKVSIAKERAFGDYIEGVLGGLEPKEMTVGELVEHSSSLMDQAIADSFERRLVLERFGVKGQRPRASGFRQFGTPLYAGWSAPSPIANFVDQLHAPSRPGLAGVDRVAAAAKGTVFGIADIGVFGTHLLDAVTTGGPRAVGAMINRSLRTMHLPHAQIWLDQNVDVVTRHGLDGVSQGLGPSAVRLKGGTLIKYVPFIGDVVDRPVSAAIDELARVQFGSILRPIRNVIHEGNLLTLHLTGSDITDPAVRRIAADEANAWTGASRGAMTPGRRQLETVALTSFQMTRTEMARLMRIAKALRPAAAKEERILAAVTLASFAGMVYGVGSAINMALGNGPIEFLPHKGDWAAIEVKGQKVPLIARRALIRAMAKSYDVLANENPADVANVWAQFAVAKLNPATAPIQSALGVGFEIGGGFRTGTLSAKSRLLNMAPLPPIFEALITEPEQRTSATGLGLEFTGFNVFPVSEFTRFERAQETVFQERRSRGEQPFVNFASYKELREADRPAAEQIDADPRVQEALQKFEEARRRDTPESRFFEETDKVRDEFRLEQEQDDESLGRYFLTGGEEGLPPKKWQDAERERAKTSFDQREGIKRAFGIEFESQEGRAASRSVNAAIEAYFAVDIDRFTDPETQEVNWGAFFDARDRAIGGLSQGDRDRVMDFINRFETPIQREFRRLREELDEYYDIPSENRREREIWRRRNPRGDAILFITGSTTTFLRGRSEAQKLVRRIFGESARVPGGSAGGALIKPSSPLIGGTPLIGQERPPLIGVR